MGDLWDSKDLLILLFNIDLHVIVWLFSWIMSHVSIYLTYEWTHSNHAITLFKAWPVVSPMFDITRDEHGILGYWLNEDINVVIIQIGFMGCASLVLVHRGESDDQEGPEYLGKSVRRHQYRPRLQQHTHDWKRKYDRFGKTYVKSHEEKKRSCSMWSLSSSASPWPQLVGALGACVGDPFGVPGTVTIIMLTLAF